MPDMQRKPIFLWVLLICLASFSGPLLANALAGKAPTLNVSDISRVENLWAYADYLIEADRQRSFEQIQYAKDWQHAEGSRSSWSYLAGAAWLRINLYNQLSAKRHLVLEQPYTQTDEIQVFLVQDKEEIGRFSGGDHFPRQGHLASRTAAFELQVPPGASTLYIKTSSKGMVSATYRLLDFHQYIALENEVLAYINLQLGALAILIIYNSFLFFSLRLKIYLYYSLYLLFFINVQFIFSGVGQILLDPESTVGTFYFNTGLHFFIKMALGFAFLFTVQFLNLKTFRPRLGKIMQALAYIVIFLAPLSAAIPYRIDSKLTLFLTAFFSVSMLITGIHFSFRGYRPAYYYSAGWTMLLLGTLVTTLKVLGYLPINLFTDWAQITGSTLEGAILSLALGERFNYFQKKASQERESYIHQLIEQEKARTHSYGQLEKIVYPHQLSKIKMGEQLEQTMPTGSEVAYVLCMDTIGSSHLPDEAARPFLTRYFQKCALAMQESYNPATLQAKAYRINEVGDGFFCSVGFPFKTPADHSSADTAYLLARQLIELFDETYQEYAADLPYRPYCSVALVKDSIEAYYSKAGVASYSLYGRALVLAERYEKLRKSVFSKPLQQNILVTHQKVYDDLSPRLQEELQEYDLAAQNRQVRDDAEAKRFYYLLESNASLSQSA